MFNPLFLLLSLISAPDPQATNSALLSERIEAKVGQEIITSSDVLQMAAALASLHRDEKPDFIRKKALETLIDRSLMRVHLDRLGMSVTDKDVEQRVSSIRSSNGISSNEEFRTMLLSQGLTFDQFKDQVRAQMENIQFMNVMRRQAVHTIEDKELQAYFQRSKTEFSNNKEVELQECVIASGNNSQQAQALAQSFKSNPNTFGNCVAHHSQSPSKVTDGKIGVFQSGLLREDIEEEVFKLKKGQVAIIPQQGGYQLLKVLSTNDLGPQSFDAVRDKIRERLETEIIQKEIQRTMADLRATTYIQI